MYKFDPKGEAPDAAFRAIAIDQLDEALSDLDTPDSSDRSAVHEARRRTKKLRGLLRLVRAGFDDFDQENVALRDAAGVLSHLRDREVQHETLAALAAWRPSPAKPARYNRCPARPCSAVRWEVRCRSDPW